jgi:hypothetical protein
MGSRSFIDECGVDMRALYHGGNPRCKQCARRTAAPEARLASDVPH